MNTLWILAPIWLISLLWYGASPHQQAFTVPLNARARYLAWGLALLTLATLLYLWPGTSVVLFTLAAISTLLPLAVLLLAYKPASWKALTGFIILLSIASPLLSRGI